MSDDAFHLTPHDVRAQEFQRTMRGFDPVQVESFKDRVAEELERLIRERTLLEERLRGMVEQLRAFRDRERAMNDALIAAQQLRDDIQSQAGREAEILVREAGAEAQAIQERALREAALVRRGTEGARRQFSTYLAGFRALLHRQLTELEGLEDGANAAEDAGANASEPSEGTEPA